jgi:hypothetical protein
MMKTPNKWINQSILGQVWSTIEKLLTLAPPVILGATDNTVCIAKYHKNITYMHKKK